MRKVGFLWGVRVDVNVNEGLNLYRGGGRVGGGRVDVNEEVKFLCKLKKKLWGGSCGGVRGSGWWEGCLGGCERRIDVFVEIKKMGGGGGLGGPVGMGGQCGCERRIEVVVEIKKKMGGGGSCRGLGVSG